MTILTGVARRMDALLTRGARARLRARSQLRTVLYRWMGDF